MGIGAAGSQDGGNLGGGFGYLRGEGSPKAGVADDPDRIYPSFYPAGQQGIVGQHRAKADHNSPVFKALGLYMASGFFPGNPLGCAGVGGDFSVHGHCVLHGDVRFPGSDIMEKDLV